MDASVVPAAEGSAVMGAPAPGIWQHHSTREVPACDRFDFWRQFPAGDHMQRPFGARGDFFGEFRCTTTPEGIGYAELEVDPCASRFGQTDTDLIQLGVVVGGRMYIRHGRDERLTLNAGSGLVLFDCARPLTTFTPRIKLAYLGLSRAAVAAAIGGDAVPQGMAVRSLPSGVLGAELAACMRGLEHDAAHSVTSVVDSIRTARALALVLLANTRGEGHRWPGELDAALYRAACYQLSLHIADPQVMVDAVAAVLGCSRAQLYRVFAARGESVAGYLYELRMRQATTLLRTRPRVAVGAIALCCGYSEPAAFNKAFRRRFHMTPGDRRAALVEAAGVSM